MDSKNLKLYLAGLGVAGLLAGSSAVAADKPAAGGTKEGEAKSAATATAVKSEQTKTAKSG